MQRLKTIEEESDFILNGQFIKITHKAKNKYTKSISFLTPVVSTDAQSGLYFCLISNFKTFGYTPVLEKKLSPKTRNLLEALWKALHCRAQILKVVPGKVFFLGRKVAFVKDDCFCQRIQHCQTKPRLSSDCEALDYLHISLLYFSRGGTNNASVIHSHGMTLLIITPSVWHLVHQHAAVRGLTVPVSLWISVRQNIKFFLMNS